jgi:hypothetical protein
VQQVVAVLHRLLDRLCITFEQHADLIASVKLRHERTGLLENRREDQSDHLRRFWGARTVRSTDQRGGEQRQGRVDPRRPVGDLTERDQ